MRRSAFATQMHPRCTSQRLYTQRVQVRGARCGLQTARKTPKDARKQNSLQQQRQRGDTASPTGCQSTRPARGEHNHQRPTRGGSLLTALASEYVHLAKSGQCERRARAIAGSPRARLPSLIDSLRGSQTGRAFPDRPGTRFLGGRQRITPQRGRPSLAGTALLTRIRALDGEAGPAARGGVLRRGRGSHAARGAGAPSPAPAGCLQSYAVQPYARACSLPRSGSGAGLRQCVRTEEPRLQTPKGPRPPFGSCAAIFDHG